MKKYTGKPAVGKAVDGVAKGAGVSKAARGSSKAASVVQKGVTAAQKDGRIGRVPAKKATSKMPTVGWAKRGGGSRST